MVIGVLSVSLLEEVDSGAVESLVVEPWWARFQVVALLQLQVVKKHVSDSVDL